MAAVVDWAMAPRNGRAIISKQILALLKLFTEFGSRFECCALEQVVIIETSHLS
jgi:hypothetical protein